MAAGRSATPYIRVRTSGHGGVASRRECAVNCKIGVDVSKKKLDVAVLLAEGKYRSKVFSNDADGFANLLEWIDANAPGGRASVHVCMESTGVYHEALALSLHDVGVKLSVINPLLLKRFMESERVRNKTDAGDAKALARFCDKTSPELWEAPTKAVRQLQALIGRLDALLEMRRAELNRRELAHGVVLESIGAVLEQLERSIQEVRELIKQTIDDDPELKQRRDLLDTIPGLGDRTIPQLLAYIGRPERFKSVKALIAYAGLTPMIRQSGSSLNKTRGTHPLGNRELKRSLFYPAMVAGQHNPVVARFWQRLKAQNKPGKVVVVACMHKLLAIIYGVLKSRTPFDATRLPAA